MEQNSQHYSYNNAPFSYINFSTHQKADLKNPNNYILNHYNIAFEDFRIFNGYPNIQEAFLSLPLYKIVEKLNDPQYSKDSYKSIFHSNCSGDPSKANPNYNIHYWLESDGSYSMTLFEIHKKIGYDNPPFHKMIANLPFSVLIVDEEGYRITSNSMQERLFGTIPPSWYTIFKDPVFDNSEMKSLLQKAKDGEVVTFPDFHYDPSNNSPETIPSKKLWLSMIIFTVFVEELNSKFYVLIHEDVSIRKKAELETELSRQTYFEIYNSVSEGIYIQDRDGKFLDVNDEGCKMNGYTKEELMGKTPQFLSAPDKNDLQHINQLINKIFDNGGVDSFEFWAVRKNGEIFPKNVTLKKGSYFGKEVIIATAVNISEQKRDKESIEQQKIRLDNILNGTNAGTWEWDITNNQLIVNERWAEMIGYTKEELGNISSKEFVQLLHPDDYKEIYENLKRHFEGETEFFSAESRFKHKNGSWVYFMDRARVYERDSTGKPLKMSGTRQDISARKHAEIELNKSLEKNSAILNAIPDLMFIFDYDGNIIDYKCDNNESLYVTPNLFLKKSIYDVLPADISQLTLEKIALAENTRKPVEYSYKLNISGKEEVFESRLVKCGNNEYLSIVRNISDQVKTKNELIESQSRLLTLINSTPDIICFKDGKGRWMIANDADLELFCLKHVDFRGKTDIELAEFTDPIYKNAFITCVENDEKAWNAKRVVISEETIPTKNGVQLVYETIKVPIFDENGDRKGLVILGRNITERKKSEEKIIESQKKLKSQQDLFRNVADNMPDMLWAKDLKGKYLFANKALCENLFQIRDTSTPIGKTYEECTRKIKEQPEYINDNNWFTVGIKHTNYDNIVLDTGLSTRYEENGYIKGVFKCLDIIKSPLLNANNEIIGVVGAARDITEKKRDEREIKLLGKSIEQSPVSILITDENGVIKYVNPKLCSVSGFTPSELIGTPIYELQRDIKRDVDFKYMLESIKSGKEWHGEVKNYKKDGEEYWENISVSPIFDDSGKIINYISIKEDITQKKRNFEELTKAKEKAEESDRLKSAFLANMSHEIRTPLNGILGFSNYINSGGLNSDEIVEYSGIISQCGEKLLSMINNIIEISRIDTNKIDTNLKQVNPAKLINECANQFFFNIKDAGIELVTQIPNEQQEITLLTDSLRLNQIITNLINNAIKFTKVGYIKVGYKTDSNNVIFYVEDTGIGIDKDNIDKIFDRFYQVDNSFARGYDGVGLGLSLCKGFAELLGGKIWVDSQIGKGSTFYVQIPR